MTPNVFKWTDIAAERGIRILAILLIALILNRLLRSLTRRLIPTGGTEGLGRVARLHEQHVKTLAGLMYSAGTAVIVVGAILTALPEFGFNVTPIAAAAGLASLAIGFGAQHLVRDLINGFFIIIEDQFVVGEIVRIGTVVGRVEHVTLRRTVIVLHFPAAEVSDSLLLSQAPSILIIVLIIVFTRLRMRSVRPIIDEQLADQRIPLSRGPEPRTGTQQG